MSTDARRTKPRAPRITVRSVNSSSASSITATASSVAEEITGLRGGPAAAQSSSLNGAWQSTRTQMQRCEVGSQHFSPEGAQSDKTNEVSTSSRRTSGVSTFSTLGTSFTPRWIRFCGLPALIRWCMPRFRAAIAEWAYPHFCSHSLR